MDEQSFGKDYFDELLERIREIRASERRAYQKNTDVFEQCSYDYDKNSEITKAFYAFVQNKLHFAVTGKTAAELIYECADSEKPAMGLTTWKDSPDGKILKRDIGIAKNYLNEKELSRLNRLVTMFIDYAELMAEDEILMSMQDWSELKTYKNWESHIINKCSQFTETTRLNFVHYIKGKKRSEENKIATLDAIWMPLNIFVLTVLLTFMFAFAELIKNYNAAASEIVTNYFVSNTNKLYEQTARLLEFNFKESIIFYGMFSVIILIIGVTLYVLGKNRRMNIANKISFYEDIILIIEKENN